VVASARKLHGAEINLSGPHGSTVTGTCNVLTAAALARGTTRLSGAACEPEVVDLGQFLNACGARIFGLGTSELIIEGVSELHPSDYTIIADRIEAATWMIAAAITQGDLTITHADPAALLAVIEQLEQTGAEIEIQADSLRVSASAPPRPCDLQAVPYPGFPTDVQAQFTALMTLAEGPSRVTDTVFPERFMHASELMRMGANVRRCEAGLQISGVSGLSGAHVMASDLRASAALILAALAAKGESIIHRIYHLDRGYERLAEKLSAVGASVRREKEHGPESRLVPPPHWNTPVKTASTTPLNRPIPGER
jgi:UDP-N-acetylglucosamine 1-carboxyvinyltransferase